MSGWIFNIQHGIVQSVIQKCILSVTDSDSQLS